MVYTPLFMVIHYWFKHIVDVPNDTKLYLTIDSAGSRAFNDFNGIIVIISTNPQRNGAARKVGCILGIYG